MIALFPDAATTDGVTVRVAVSYQGDERDVQQGRWFWTYHIRIENGRADAVQLRTRHWVITDGHGTEHRVDGDGVIGEQPVIAPGGAYDYVSGCPLMTPTGRMTGHYRMIADDGSWIDVAIPRMALVAPASARGRP